MGDSVVVKQKQTNKLMTKFNAETCIVVNITGPEVTVRTKGGKLVCRNKSFIKKIPVPEGISDSDDEGSEDSSTHPVHDTPIVPAGNDNNTAEPSRELRSSSRISNPPERYGFPVPSELVGSVLEKKE